MIFKEFRDAFVEFAQEYEHIVTAGLVVVVLILLAIAIFGKPQHKAIALGYVVLPF